MLALALPVAPVVASGAPDAHAGGLAGPIGTTIAMMAIAITVGVFTKFVRVPYTIALVLVGLAIALLDAAPRGAVITHELIFLLLLPPLLFQAGLHLDLRHLARVWLPVLILALPGVVITTLFVGVPLRQLIPHEALGDATPLVDALGEGRTLWLVALLFGVVVAPTDPVSVLATFKAAGVEAKLKTIVEGESLFNDATAVAIYALLAGAIVAALNHAGPGGAIDAGAFSPAVMGVSFVKVAGLGTLVGLVLGAVAYCLIRLLHDHTLETAITIALAWGSFLLAEQLHASGVIATVVAGMLIGNYAKDAHMPDEVGQALRGFWDSADFVVNSILFLMIGFELSAPEIGGRAALTDVTTLTAAGVTIGALLLARAAVVYPVCALLGRSWPAGWKHVIWWSGLKGSLSLALLLMLPDGSLRRFLLPVAFIVVLASLIGQGVSMPLLIRGLGLRAGRDEDDDDGDGHEA